MRLPRWCYEKAGKPMTFEVERELASGERKTVTLTVTPDDTPPGATFGMSKDAWTSGAGAVLSDPDPSGRGAARLAGGQGRPQAR